MKKKILIIDDDHLILYGLGKALRNEAVEVTTASSATMAEAELALCSYDLCLIDLHLPDGNGLDLMRTIRLTCPYTRMIVMTASYVNDEELSSRIREAAAHGACHFLPKPFDLGELKKIIVGVLAEGEESRPGKTTESGMTRRTRTHSRHAYSQPMEIAIADEAERQGGQQSSMATTVDISEGGVGLRTRLPLAARQRINMRSGLSEKMGIVVWSRMLTDTIWRAGVRFA